MKIPPIDLRAGAGSVPGTGATRSGRGSAQVEAAFSGPPVAEAALPVVSGEEATPDGVRGGETLPRGANLRAVSGTEALHYGAPGAEAAVDGALGEETQRCGAYLSAAPSAETLHYRAPGGEATVGGARGEKTPPREARKAAREAEDVRLDQVRARAQFLMDALGQQELKASLGSRGWDFAFDRAKKRLGSCQFTRSRSGGRRITLSRHLAASTPLDYVDPNGLRLVAGRRAAGCGLPAPGFGVWVLGVGLWASGFGRRDPF